MHQARGATLNLADSTVRGNRAPQGGGIGSLGGGSGTVTITRSTVSGNRADVQGGGIVSLENLRLENTTVSGNRTGGHGGGVLQQGGTLTVTDSTVAFNTAQQPGGGISWSGNGAIKLQNTIVSNNSSDFAFGKNCDRPVVSAGNNLEKGTSCSFAQAGDKNADPKLGPLENNGGPTNTHALLGGSAAIDAGGVPFPATDQRGVARPQSACLGRACGPGNDIGAVEKKPRRR